MYNKQGLELACYLSLGTYASNALQDYLSASVRSSLLIVPETAAAAAQHSCLTSQE